MILRINESTLYEDIAAVKKYYPTIPDDTFMEIIALDPTYTGKDSVGKYGKWLLNLFNRGKISEKDFEEIPELLNQFTTYKNRIQNKDLNAYKTLDDLAETLASVIDDMSMLTPSQKTKFLKRVKSGKITVDKSDDYDIVLDTPNFIVYVPNTHEASMKLGKGTKWCTAHENPDWYNHYTENGGKLYIIKNKKTDERWQYSDDTGDFLDENDDEFDIMSLLGQDDAKQLSKFFEKFLGVDYYNFDGTWNYTGKPIPDSLREHIEYIIISDNVTTITDFAFWDLYNLKSVQIPNSVTTISYMSLCNCVNLKNIIIPDSVTEIGVKAFSDCVNLESIIIPNSVTWIGEQAFARCTNLKSVTLPDNITEISVSTFKMCTSLVSIKIPNGVTSIGNSAFSGCESLTNVIIPDSVTRIRQWAFTHCTNLTSIALSDNIIEVGHSAFMGCDDITIYSDNDYVMRYCNKYDIPIESIKAKNESYGSLKLKIKEF